LRVTITIVIIENHNLLVLLSRLAVCFGCLLLLLVIVGS